MESIKKDNKKYDKPDKSLGTYKTLSKKNLKNGKKYKNDILGFNSLVEDFIEWYLKENNRKDNKFARLKIRVKILKHLADLRDNLLVEQEGVILPNMLGFLQVRKFKLQIGVLDRRESEKVGKKVLRDLSEQDDFFYKPIWSKYYHATQKIVNASFEDKDMWFFKKSFHLQRKLNKIIKEKINSSQPITYVDHFTLIENKRLEYLKLYSKIFRTDDSKELGDIDWGD